MTFSARREPSFHGAHSASPIGTQFETHAGSHAGGVTAPPHAAATGFARFVSTLQIVGSLLAVPLGLASGYSIYRANFSVETTCRSLRSNIIGMLDKNVDAGTRRMLVNRDITAFEQNCGSVDPDAHAAFNALLATPAVTGPKASSATPPVEVARKPESKIQSGVEAKPGLKAVAKADTKADTKAETKVQTKSETRPDELEAGLSDARWLAAVRQALVTHARERAATTEPVHPTPASAARPLALEISKSPRVVLQPAWNVPAAAVAPQAMSGVPARAPQTQLNNTDHPVPPASIPLIAALPGDGQQAGDQHGGSRLGTWIAQIPFVGRVIEPRGR